MFRVRMATLPLYSGAALARIGREHHHPAVRFRAWTLKGTFIAGKGTYFNPGIMVVIRNWGELAARLGERVAIAPGVVFVAASGPCDNRLVDIEGFADRYVKYAPITVGDDAWIGANAIILPGVTIGKLSVLGAGAVVAKDVPDYAVVAGVPAKIVGDVRNNRKENDQSLPT